MNKIYILGLPRTGTTSVCAALLRLGFKVAHTAYTQETFNVADAVADTPVYCDYPFLDRQFPNSRFIYLARKPESWALSMIALLEKLQVMIEQQSRGYHPILERCLREVFEISDWRNLPAQETLVEKYLQHQNKALDYFAQRPQCFLQLNLESPDAYQNLCKFVQRKDDGAGFDILNREGRVFEWESLRHPLKIGSHERNQDGRKYFDLDH